MKLLTEFDVSNYDANWKKCCRKAVRAIIISNGKIALVKSFKDGFYKFPGGGIEPGESHCDTLIRETLEETGLHIKPDSIKEFGMICERRKSKYFVDEIFEQWSYYYLADVEDFISAQNLDKYEAELGYCLEWTDIGKAYRTNIALPGNTEHTFLKREAYVLKQLL